MTEAARLAAAVERLLALLARERGRIGGEPSPLTATQSLALAAVVDAGELRLRALSEAIGTTDATGSRTVDVLEELRLVRRTPDPADRRGVLVRATPAGRRMRLERRSRLARVLEQLLADLPPRDRERFVELLGGLADFLDEHDVPLR